jgi:lipoprotein-anchoring transpeptidase ErfK/SrfK
MIDRRIFMAGLPLALAGCVTRREPSVPVAGGGYGYYASIYGPILDEPFPVPPVDLSQIDPQFYRQEVSFRTREKPGTVIVDLNNRFAYLVQERGSAMRYGVGVGREEAFNLYGTATVGNKAEWPRWIPTKNMIRREPERYGPWARGMDGGPQNPLGARALYLYRDGRDTYYRLHGTNEPWTIGTEVSSGCVRFLNHDIIDLYRRVPVGSKVVIRSGGVPVVG